jgi:hypothetical protein
MEIDEVDNNDYDDEPIDAEQNKPAQQRRQQRHAGYIVKMFVELDELAKAEEEVENQKIYNLNPIDDNLLNRVDAELLIYKREPHLQLRKADGTFHNPLDWWQLKE